MLEGQYTPKLVAQRLYFVENKTELELVFTHWWKIVTESTNESTWGKSSRALQPLLNCHLPLRRWDQNQGL